MYAQKVRKIFAWDEEKNRKLSKERGVSFQAVVSSIGEGMIIATVARRGKFSHQKQYLVVINDYVYIVPFVEEEQRIFLKTIIPSRKMTKRYLFGGD
ncbi:MAG: BrnT family toxin [Nanoarchaeota archaeon]